MLLTESNPLLVIPELAKEVGITEAIILQQIHYWVQHNKEKHINLKDGQYWTYNSVSNWQKQFPWICEATIKRTLIEMQKNGFILTGVYNKAKYDRTKWYRVNYESETLQKFGCFCEPQETLSEDWWTDKEFTCPDTQETVIGYPAYLQTRHWKEMRVKVAEAHNYTCERCCGVFRSNFDVHHNTYKRVGKEKMGDLSFLCDKCHCIITKAKKDKAYFNRHYKQKIMSILAALDEEQLDNAIDYLEGLKR